ncbi:MAG: leucine-rich repeat protein [Lachnospiraceae bacterium]|nr:leucine-rich repeat protein [Lachnospiraceae bacterium]
MKKWKRVLGAICIVLLFTSMLKNYQISDQNRNITVRAASNDYKSIEVDGVTWRYALFKENINRNPQYQDLNKENIATCVKIKLENTNGNTDITIPDTIEGYPVYQIEQGSAGAGSEVVMLKIPVTVEWIGEKAFFNWSSLKEVKFWDRKSEKSTIREIPEEKMHIYYIGDEAFSCCVSLSDIPIKETIFSKEDANIGKGIFTNCKGLKKISISCEGEKAYIPQSTFENCNLEDGIQISNNIRELTIDNYGFRGCKIKNLTIPCNCFLGTEVFAENKELQRAEFKGNVQNKGKEILKKSFNTNDNTELIFSGEDIELGAYGLAGSRMKSLLFLNPNGTASLGYRCIFESGIGNIEFKNKNVIIKEGGGESTNEKLSQITFENSDTTYLSDGAFYSYLSHCENMSYPSVKKLEFQCRKVVYENISGPLTEVLRKSSVFEDRRIVYGTKVEQVSGMQGIFLSKFAEVYIENPMTEHEVTFLGSNPRIYGYSKHKEISPDFMEIQKRGLSITYEDSEIINTKGIDLSKLHVYTELKTGNRIEITTGKIMGEEEIPKPETEEGYILQYGEQISDYEGIMPVKIYYQDASDDLELPVVPKKENKIQVEWSESYGDNLIEGQNIDLEQLVEKVKVYYNDGSCIEKDAKALELVNGKITKGENNIIVCLKGNMKIRDSFQCVGKENQIQRVEASYNKKEVYLGDKIELDKINLRAVYTLEDENKNTNLPCKKISKTTFDLEGKNIIRVYYTDEMYSDMEVQVKVPKPVKVEAAYKEGYPCYGINEEIKQEAIEIFVTLENQKVLTNSQLEEPFIINILSYSGKDITATITYKGIKSNQFKIPLLENKIISISPILSKESVLEGSLIGRELVSYLRFSYENGTSELVKLDDLDQTQLQISEGYLAVARQWNIITITYMGIKCKAEVWGEEDNAIVLDVQYLGRDIEVGKSIHLEDCKVYLVKKSGKKILLTDGITIINPIISKAGENVIYFCYGAFQGSVKVNGIKNSAFSEKSEIFFSIKSNHNRIQTNKKIVYSVQTNKAVKFILQTQNISNIQYQFVTKGQKINTKKWKDVKKNSFTVKNTEKKYGILYIRYTLPNGNIYTVHTTGFCIDTILPKTNIKKNQCYKRGKKVQFSDNFGVKWAKLDGKNIKTGTIIKKAGKHILVVMDKAGNKISIPFSIL